MTILLATEHEDPPKLTGLWLSYFFLYKPWPRGVSGIPFSWHETDSPFFLSAAFIYLEDLLPEPGPHGVHGEVLLMTVPLAGKKIDSSALLFQLSL